LTPRDEVFKTIESVHPWSEQSVNVDSYLPMYYVHSSKSSKGQHIFFNSLRER
jgi:hypothetical protein